MQNYTDNADSLKLGVSKTEEKKCRVIQVIKDADHVNKLCYITVLYYCGSSHWRCSGLNFVTFKLVSRENSKNCINL